MFTAEVTKGFRYVETTVPRLVDQMLGAVTSTTTRDYPEGHVMKFATHADYKEFKRLAEEYGGSVKCVGLPPR